MEIPLEITFKNMPPSPAVETQVRTLAEKLERFSEHIIRCRVVIEAPQRRHHQGGLFRVGLTLTTPHRKRIVVNRRHPKDHAYEDAHVAIHDAFTAAARRLEDVVRRQDGAVKFHPVAPRARISSLFADYGFLKTDDGQEIYFHRNSVLGKGFLSLQIGDEVRFSVAENESPKGPQATTVHPVHKRRATA